MVTEHFAEWLQTSYNANFRGAYAGVGMIYNPTLDAFEFAPPTLMP